MKSFRAGIAFSLLAFLTASAFGQEPAELRWKFEKGKTFWQETVTDLNQTVSVKGMEIPVKVKQSMVMSWTPVRQLDNKGWVIKQKTVGFKMDMELLGQKYSYDSAKPEGAPKDLAEGLKPLVGAELEFTLGPDFKTTKVAGFQAILDKLGQANPKAKQALAGVMNEESLKQISDANFAVLPTRPVAKGATWNVDTKTSMGGLGSLEVRRQLTYAGKVGKLDQIKLESKSIKHMLGGGNAGGLPFGKLKKLDLKKSSDTGTFLFDRDKGRIDSSDETVKLEGKIVAEANGQELELDLTHTQKTTVKTSDTNPLQK
jgi:hypothetical protein